MATVKCLRAETMQEDVFRSEGPRSREEKQSGQLLSGLALDGFDSSHEIHDKGVVSDVGSQSAAERVVRRVC
jgi:hypothetical protein